MAEAPPSRGAGPKILVVDDDENILELAAECIRHALGDQYHVAKARDGKEAIASIERDPPDLILLDILMPEMDGLDVCRWLKSSPATAHIPTVFLTALGEDSSIEQGLALGAEGYIVKPFNAVTLAAQISELLTPRESESG